jgi:hypothetical protein
MIQTDRVRQGASITVLTHAVKKQVSVSIYDWKHPRFFWESAFFWVRDSTIKLGGNKEAGTVREKGWELVEPKKDGSAIVTRKPKNQKNVTAILLRAYREATGPRPVPLMLLLLINILQAEKEVKLETIARMFPIGITCEGRRRKIQRFLDLPSLTISSLL